MAAQALATHLDGRLFEMPSPVGAGQHPVDSFLADLGSEAERVEGVDGS